MSSDLLYEEMVERLSKIGALVKGAWKKHPTVTGYQFVFEENGKQMEAIIPVFPFVNWKGEDKGIHAMLLAINEAKPVKQDEN